MEGLFARIRRYGTFLAEFCCTNHFGMAIRVRVAEYDGKKYFIVQCNGTVAELLEISCRMTENVYNKRIQQKA